MNAPSVYRKMYSTSVPKLTVNLTSTEAPNTPQPLNLNLKDLSFVVKLFLHQLQRRIPTAAVSARGGLWVM